jgi:hypothetical protein
MPPTPNANHGPRYGDRFLHQALHGNAINPDNNRIAEYLELKNSSVGAEWEESNAEEIGRLAQGYKNIKGTNTIHFIKKSQLPHNARPTYLHMVCANRPEKENPKRVRWTAGGDRIDYPGGASTKTADITTVKIVLNSVISTPKARYMTCDLKDFYLGTPMKKFEYMKIHIKYIPKIIMDLYNLWEELVDDNGFVYVEIRRGMYAPPQAGRITYDYLKDLLAPHGYSPCELTPGLWKHKTRPIAFSLVVDDFGVKYVNKADVDYLLSALS